MTAYKWRREFGSKCAFITDIYGYDFQSAFMFAIHTRTQFKLLRTLSIVFVQLGKTEAQKDSLKTHSSSVALSCSYDLFHFTRDVSVGESKFFLKLTIFHFFFQGHMILSATG